MRSLFIVWLFALTLSSCSTTYYQLYSTKSVDLKEQQNVLTYESPEVEVVYNLWSEGGNCSFSFVNKTDKNIYVNLQESHLIINGQAFTYYRNRTFEESSSSTVVTSFSQGSSFSVLATSAISSLYGNTNYMAINKNALSSSQGSSTTLTAKTAISKGNSVSYREESIICIPQKSYKVIDGFRITDELIRNCNLIRFPKGAEVPSQDFTEVDSPLKLTNIISYSYNSSLVDTKVILNTFWINNVSNYSEVKFRHAEYAKFCDQKSMYSQYLFDFYNPSKFYMRYSKDVGNDLIH